MSDFKNYEAEEALLGILLNDETAWTLISFSLEPDHMALPLHGRLLAQVLEERKNGAVTSAILNARFQYDVGYEDAGGSDWLYRLAESAPENRKIDAFAKEIFSCWQMRQMSEMFKKAMSFQSPADAMIEIRRQLSRIDAFEDSGDDFEDLQTIAGRRIDELQIYVTEKRQPGLLTGLGCIDRLGGLMPSTEIVIGGRPGMGKTAMLRSILHGAAERNEDHDFLFFSVEMTKEQGIDRSLSATTYTIGDTMIPPQEYRGFKKPNYDQIRSIAAVRGHLPKNVLISSRGRLSIDDVRRGASRLQAKRKRPIGAIGVDYLQIMNLLLERGESVASAISRVTAEGKRIAKDFGCTMIFLSQLSRGVEAREDKRPNLSDLKESGSIEQDADYVLFPYRPHYYESRKGAKKEEVQGDYDDRMRALEHLMQVGIAKARDDACADHEMFCNMAYDIVANKSSGER